MAKKKKEKAPEYFEGGQFLLLPFAVLESVAWQGASDAAKALLIDVASQHNGHNNGHFQATMRWLKTRGWNSRDKVNRAKQVLLDRGLLVETRKGGLHRGWSCYAVTWHDITNFKDLDIRPGEYLRGGYAAMNGSPLSRKGRGAAKPRDGTLSSVKRSNAAPTGGLPGRGPAPPDGPQNAETQHSVAPLDGDYLSVASVSAVDLVRGLVRISCDEMLDRTVCALNSPLLADAPLSIPSAA